MSLTWPEEVERILWATHSFAVDPAYVAAIRRQENGRPGREYGVLTIPAPTYEDQLVACCRTLRNRLVEFRGNPLGVIVAANGSKRISYSWPFNQWFGSRWAPLGAANDPRGLNAYWTENVFRFYQQFARDGLAT